ncbi:hypothetical protein EIP91_012368 [Steccherinum ochraceum]|uniref:Aldehyde dehydrogenase domain-containing protein n=1 Tax=Steccherinum ochraceum TaxID=92696 RepID=A0A4R0RGQ8_9APHY|nr:hypothetical protein EIP91_012368 [Steccherinum ochraceum]
MIMKDNALPFTSLLIDGETRPSQDDKVFEVRNPYSGNVVGQAAAAFSEDCREAIETANKAYQQWEHSTLQQRRDIFLQAADLLASDRYSQKIATCMREETAAIDGLHYFNHHVAVASLRDAAGMISDLKGEICPSHFPGGQMISQRRAMGVILAIAPWNVPILLSIRAVAIPILCGNAVILKCSEISPRTQSIVAELFLEAGLPKGVLNFISMDRNDAPALTREIIANPLVRKINFTGSDVVGRILAAEAAKFLKPCVFELGGKSPVVVLNDADLDKAARAIVSSGIYHSGQVCISTERVLIQSEASKTLVPLIVAHMKDFIAGDCAENPDRLSTLFSGASAERLIGYIDEAKKEGADLLVGDALKDGNSVVQPHVLTGCKPGMKIWDRESFGPVLVIGVADTVDELITLANTSDYSLAAGVWSGSLSTALSVANRIRSGFTNINGPTLHVEGNTHAGLGGASGYGHFDVESFTDMRRIVIHPEGPAQYPLVG